MRVGIIGCGRMGRLHAASYRKAGAVVSAVADVQAEAAASLAAEVGASACTDYWRMLAEERLDAVTVATPPAMHKEQTLAAIEAGIPVLCEKPLAESAEAARHLASAVVAAGGICMVGFFHRFHQPLLLLKERIARGELGSPVTIRTRFSVTGEGNTRPWIWNPSISGGGSVMNTAVHAMDLFRFLTGGEIRNLKSVTGNVQDPGRPVEDTALILLQGESGNFGIVESYDGAPFRGYELWVQGSRGEATVGWAPPSLRVKVTPDSAWLELPVEAQSPLDRLDNGVAYFLECVRRGTPPSEATLADGVKALELAEAVYQSAKSP